LSHHLRPPVLIALFSLIFKIKAALAIFRPPHQAKSKILVFRSFLAYSARRKNLSGVSFLRGLKHLLLKNFSWHDCAIIAPKGVHIWNLLEHSQAFFYHTDIGLHLPQVVCVSGQDILTQFLDLFQCCISIFAHCFYFA